jgi:hypothetical protein
LPWFGLRREGGLPNDSTPKNFAEGSNSAP